MEIELNLQGNLIPSDSHLKKLESLPPLKPDANRRLIRPEMDYGEIIGYVMHDFSGIKYRGMKYVTVGKLESMSE
jgi:hypothetical protein